MSMLTIAADPKHLGTRIGILSVLYTWGDGGGLSLDGERWIASRPGFLPPRAGALAPVPPVPGQQPGDVAVGEPALLSICQ
jgi:hypothetical protein